MATKDDLVDWLIDALLSNEGSASIVQVAKHIWTKHENELKNSGDLFFTWQYDVRWAVDKLRKEGKMRAASSSPRGLWQLA